MMSTVVSEAPASVARSDWDTFLEQVRETVMSHPVVTNNEYCNWFNRGQASREQVRDLIQQFSVFSNLFIVAQLLKTINAPTVMQAREFLRDPRQRARCGVQQRAHIALEERRRNRCRQGP